MNKIYTLRVLQAQRRNKYFIQKYYAFNIPKGVAELCDIFI
jgi:hypothetical protein